MDHRGTLSLRVMHQRIAQVLVDDFPEIVEALTLAQTLAHPFSLSAALNRVAQLHTLRREWRTAEIGCFFGAGLVRRLTDGTTGTQEFCAACRVAG